MKIDEKDRKILGILAKDSRKKLVEISQDVGLSVDAVKARIDKLKKGDIIKKFSIVPNLKELGYPISLHIYIKLKNMSGLGLMEFLNFLKTSPRITSIMSVLGDYDLFITLLAKDLEDGNKMETEIRQKFNNMIDDWKEVTVSKVHKLEEYKF